MNTIAKACFFTAMFSQLSIFTADCLLHPIQMAGIETIIMGVAHSKRLTRCAGLIIILGGGGGGGGGGGEGVRVLRKRKTSN